MPDFENVRIRVPYEAQVAYARSVKNIVVDEMFEIPIPCFSRSDACLAMTLIRDDLPNGKLEFFEVDDRLFRPFLIQHDDYVWNAERCRATPPLMRMKNTWESDRQPPTVLLGSPFRTMDLTANAGQRREAQKANPGGREDARIRLATHAANGLKFIDGILHHETRTPA